MTPLHQELVDAIDWTGVHHIVDVGGSHGDLLAAVLERLPEATGLLFDRPQVVEGAAAALDAAGVADRVDVEGGSFFDAVPPGGDLYLVADVLGSWDDDEAEHILRRCHDAMAPSARLRICEPTEQTRTAEAWRALLTGSGFEPTSTTETSLGWRVIDAAPR